MRRAAIIFAASLGLMTLNGCVDYPDHSYGGEGLGSVDRAYYDSPRDFDYQYAPAYVGGAYYYDYGWPYYSRPYYGGGRGYRDHDHGWGGGHDDRGGDHGHGDHDSGPGPTPPSPPPTANDGPDKPSYNDMRAGKLNPHIHENVGGNRQSHSGGGGGKH